MNADVYQGPWGGANCRDSIAQVKKINKKIKIKTLKVFLDYNVDI